MGHRAGAHRRRPVRPAGPGMQRVQPHARGPHHPALRAGRRFPHPPGRRSPPWSAATAAWTRSRGSSATTAATAGGARSPRSGTCRRSAATPASGASFAASTPRRVARPPARACRRRTLPGAAPAPQRPRPGLDHRPGRDRADRRDGGAGLVRGSGRPGAGQHAGHFHRQVAARAAVELRSTRRCPRRTGRARRRTWPRPPCAAPSCSRVSSPVSTVKSTGRIANSLIVE